MDRLKDGSCTKESFGKQLWMDTDGLELLPADKNAIYSQMNTCRTMNLFMIREIHGMPWHSTLLVLLTRVLEKKGER